MWKALLTCVLMIACSIVAVAQPTATFHFLEGNTIVTIQGGQRQVVNLVNANGPVQFEIGLVQVPRTDPGVVEHWQVFGRNLGGIGQLSDPDGAVHPLEVYVQFDNTGVSDPVDQIFDRDNQKMAHVLVTSQNKVYGLRDAWLQEPTRLQTTSDGIIRFYCLDGRAPPNGFPPYYGKYQNSFNGTPGEDPLSANHHRWKGGFMKLWDVIVTDSASWQLIELDPMPVNIPGEWYYKTRHAVPGARTPYPPRVKKVMESLDKINVGPSAGDPNKTVLKDPVGGRTLLWWIFQAENRFRYWGNVNNQYLNVGPLAHQVGWKDWLCLKWQEGHYNNGYNWSSIVFRRWLDTRSPVAWWIFTRMAKWESTSGLVWSGNYDLTGKFVPNIRFGSDWYERPQEAGKLGQIIGRQTSRTTANKFWFPTWSTINGGPRKQSCLMAITSCTEPDTQPGRESGEVVLPDGA